MTDEAKRICGIIKDALEEVAIDFRLDHTRSIMVLARKKKNGKWYTVVQVDKEFGNEE